MKLGVCNVSRRTYWDASPENSVGSGNRQNIR